MTKFLGNVDDCHTSVMLLLYCGSHTVLGSSIDINLLLLLLSSKDKDVSVDEIRMISKESDDAESLLKRKL